MRKFDRDWRVRVFTRQKAGEAFTAASIGSSRLPDRIDSRGKMGNKGTKMKSKTLAPMNNLILYSALLSIAIPFSDFAAESVSQGDYPDPERFAGDIEAFEAADQTSPPPKDAVLCIGSSSMRKWHGTIQRDLAPLTIIPRGFGGSNMNDVLFFADRIVLPYQPRAIVLYEGDNDIAEGVAPEKIKDTFLKLVEKIHNPLPDTRFYILSIKPSISRWKLWPQMQAANQMIQQTCEADPRLTYVDVASGMLDSSGRPKADIFVEDELHMNAKGYVIWRDILRPVLIQKELEHETGQ